MTRSSFPVLAILSCVSCFAEFPEIRVQIVPTLTNISVETG
jgi:hypothetical protein